MICLISKL